MSKCGVLFVLTVSLLGAGAPVQASLAVNNGFCSGGTYPSTDWPEGKPNNLELWGSYCGEGDKTTGSAATTPFPAPAVLNLYLAGYPDSTDVSLALENLANHTKLSLRPRENPTTRWLNYRFIVPAGWIGKQVRLAAEDHSPGLGGWLAFSQPLPAPAIWNFRDAANLLLRAASHFLLLFFPCAAFCAYAVWRGIRNVVMLGLIALAGTAAPAYAIFWLWLLSPRIGHAVSFVFPIVSAATLPFLLVRMGREPRAALWPLVSPALLIFTSSLVVLSAGFAYDGLRAPFVTAWSRFSDGLPPDNMLPYLFAEGIRSAHVPSPLLGDWLSSDRPPLQAAITVSQYPFLPQPTALGNQVLSVILQSTWILGLWTLLTAFEIDPRAIRLILATTLFWGFTFLNSFFVWPKLLAASYIVGFAALVLSRKGAAELRTNKLLPYIAGALLAFGLLSHGGSAYPVIGLFFAAILWKRRFPVPALLRIVMICAVLYTPWVLYQRLYDPPGDRLLKVQFAGGDFPDHNTFIEDVISAYSRLSFHEWLDGRYQNVLMLMDDEDAYWRNLATLLRPAAEATKDHAANEIRSKAFFHFVPNLGLLAAGPFLLALGIGKRYRTPEWKTSAVLWVLVMCTLLPWCLLMFKPRSTSIHAGTYVTVLLASSASVLAFWTVSRWLAYVVSSIQILSSVVVYGVFMRPSPGNGALLEGTAHYATIALFFAALLLCCWSLSRVSENPSLLALDSAACERRPAAHKSAKINSSH